MIRNTPLVYGERLNRDLGIYVQDSWRLNRLTVNVGIRWENAQRAGAGRRVAGRPVRAGAHLRRRSRTCPNWNDFAPRLGLVYDLFGNGKTALKYSLNRYNQSARPASPPTTTRCCRRPTTLPWRDVNGNDIAEGDARLHRLSRASAARSTSRALSPNFGIAALNEYGNYPRTWNLEQRARGVSTSCCGGLSVVGVVVAGRLPQPDHHRQPDVVDRRLHAVHVLQPDHRRSRSRSSRAARRRSAADAQPRHVRPGAQATSTSRTASRAGGAFPAAARSVGGIAYRARAHQVLHRARRSELRRRRPPTCSTASALCDDFALDIPWRQQFKLSGTREVGWGINVSMAFQNNSSPTSTRMMTVTRGMTRYPANCPSPCPAGQIIMPTARLRPDVDELHARVGRASRRWSASCSSTSRSRARSASAASRCCRRSRCST